MKLITKALFVGAGLSVTFAALLLASCTNTVVLGSKEGQKEFSVPGTPNPTWWKPAPSQNWSTEQALAFWFTPQGSWMVPYDWFVVLKQAHRDELFASDSNMKQLGYIPWPADPTWNPDALPIGFTRAPWTTPDDGTPPVSWLGPNCAACHTSAVDQPGKSPIIINGAPSRGDFYRLNYELEDALIATACNTEKFSSFLEGVNERIRREKVKGVDPEQEDTLRPKLKQEIDYLAGYLDNNLLGRENGITKRLMTILDKDGTCIAKDKNKGIDAYNTTLESINALRWKLILETEKAAQKGLADAGLKGRMAWITTQPNGDMMAKVPTVPGKARVDAVGAIFNAVAGVAIHAKDNIKLANAPVRYPYLWGTPQSAVVQWSGFADNKDLGRPLGRNAGEVLGVHGRINISSGASGLDSNGKKSIAALHEKPPIFGYSSSILVRNTGQFERWLSALSAPAWPESLGNLDTAQIARGALIFNGTTDPNVNCASCHEDLRESHKEFYQPVMVQASIIGTDPMMVDNLALKRNPISLAPWAGGDLQSTPVPSRLSVLENLVGKALEGHGLTALRVVLHTHIYHGLDQIYGGSGNNGFDSRSYKARPLYGIWAVGPYLHNGSVANLRELLTSEDQRMRAFVVGKTEYDAANVGFATQSCTPGSDEDCLDTTLPGNRNTGHSGQAYGTWLTDDQKKDLLEYLKSL